MAALNRILGLIQEGGQAVARRLLPQILPVTEMAGGGVQKAGRQLAVDTGLMKYLDAFPSVVSQQRSPGLLGSLNDLTNLEYRAPKPAWEGAPSFPSGSRPVGFLPQPYQGPGFVDRPGALVPVSVQPQRAQKIAPVAEEIPLRSSRPTPAPAPQVPEELGGQLDLRNRAGATAEVPFTTKRGAVRPEGTKIGGQPYSGKPFATERNIETVRAAASPELRPSSSLQGGRAFPEEELGRSLFIDKDMTDPWNEYEIDPAIFERFVRMGRQQTPEMSRGVRAAFGPDAGPAPMDAVTDRAFAIAQELRNAASGARTFDLSGLMDPRVMAAFGGLTAAGGLGAGLALRDRGEEGSAAVRDVPTTAETPELGIPSVTPNDAAAELARGLSILFREESGAPLGASGPSVSAVPSSPNTIATTGDQRSAAIAALSQADPAAAALDRMVAPLSPEKYSSPAEYFAAREAYAKQPVVREALAQYAASSGRDAQMQANLGKWAEANPALAYELQRRALANPAASQQSAESMTTSAIDTSLGSDNQANAIGNAEAVGRAAVAPTQGNFDLAAATAPQEKPYLQRTQDMVRQAAQNIGMYSRY